MTKHRYSRNSSLEYIILLKIQYVTYTLIYYFGLWNNLELKTCRVIFVLGIPN